MRTGFRDCYLQTCKRIAQAEGSVRLKLHINCEGHISWMHATLSGRLDADTIRCMFAVAKDAHFERPLEGRVEVNVPVNLVRAAPTPTP